MRVTFSANFTSTGFAPPTGGGGLSAVVTASILDCLVLAASAA